MNVKINENPSPVHKCGDLNEMSLHILRPLNYCSGVEDTGRGRYRGSVSLGFSSEASNPGPRSLPLVV